jgi:glycosyltransferase involved in cell wall biosynthesis
MKVYHVNYSDLTGGAARAACRIHHALLRQGVDSTLLVDSAKTGDWTVIGPTTGSGKLKALLRRKIGDLSHVLYRTGNPTLHSPAFLRSGRIRQLNASTADVVHLHWINGEMLSVAEIGRSTKPIVWNLHDMWAFCGAEHYTDGTRWKAGYLKTNRPEHEAGFDINRWTWNRKRRHWKKPFQMVACSNWMADCARQSKLMGGWPVTVVPNPIDTDSWQPVEKALARQILHLPADVPLLLFGAIGGARDPRKGFDLLADSLRSLNGKIPRLELLVFGELEPKNPPLLGYPVRYMGFLNDDASLRLLYSAADAIVVPSRIEAFGQTASEAHACGTPVIAFATGGLTDIVEHRRTGYLATPFDTQDLAAGIDWVLAHTSEACGARPGANTLGHAARERAVANLSYPVVAERFSKIYEEVLQQQN